MWKSMAKLEGVRGGLEMTRLHLLQSLIAPKEFEQSFEGAAKSY